MTAAEPSETVAGATSPAAGEAPLRPVFLSCLIVGLGGLFAGVTGPLLSAFVPPLVRDALGDRRTAIGAVMAIDNVLLLVLVPLTGVLSDRAVSRGRGRLPLVWLGYADVAQRGGGSMSYSRLPQLEADWV